MVTINSKDFYSGPWPVRHKVPPAHVQAEYDRLIAEWLANGRRLPSPIGEVADVVTVNELILAFYRHAETYYRRPDGTLTSETAEYRASLKPLRMLYGNLPVREFSPLKLTRR